MCPDSRRLPATIARQRECRSFQRSSCIAVATTGLAVFIRRWRRLRLGNEAIVIVPIALFMAISAAGRGNPGLRHIRPIDSLVLLVALAGVDVHQFHGLAHADGPIAVRRACLSWLNCTYLPGSPFFAIDSITRPRLRLLGTLFDEPWATLS